MKSLIFIWLAVVAVGVFTNNRINAWTTPSPEQLKAMQLQPVQLQPQDSIVQADRGVGAEPSRLQDSINVGDF